jgi:hypothetical protein
VRAVARGKLARGGELRTDGPYFRVTRVSRRLLNSMKRSESGDGACVETCPTPLHDRKGGCAMNINLAIGPLVALIAGILILVVPRLLNYIVAVYLIVIGLLGLFGGGLQLK